MVSYCAFHLHILMVNNEEYRFVYLFSNLYPFSIMSIYIFCSFVTFFFFCLFYWLRLRSLYVFYIQILCQICGSVQCSYSVVSGSLGTAACQASLSITTPGVHPNSSPLSRWCHPTISSSVIPFASCPQSFPDQGLFNESVSQIRWPKYWSFSFSIRPSKEHPGLISFRMDWLDLLAVQGTPKSLLQHCSSKASILQCSASQSISHIYTWLLEKS